MLRGYSFRPRLWPLLLAAAACVAGVALGRWQLGRAEEKKALAATIERALAAPPVELSAAHDAPEPVHRRVAVRGSFAPQYTVFLDNRSRAGHPGYEVVAPFRIARSDVYVLVDRGWVAAPARREFVPEVPTPAGEIRIEALALPRLPRALELGKGGEGNVRQNVAVETFVAQTGLALKTVVLEQLTDTNDGLSREWPRADLGIEKHESYALQWYSLAALALALGVGLSFRKNAA